MSFGGPPWQQRNNSLNAGQIHQQQQQQQHNSSQLGGFQSRHFNQQQAPISLLSLGTNQIFSSQTVSYPQPRALNPIAFSTNSIQRSSQNLQLQQQQQQQNHNNNQSNFNNQKGNFQIGNSNNSNSNTNNNSSNRNFLNVRDQQSQRSSSYNAVPPPLISSEKLATYSVNNNRSNRHITPERNRTPVRSRRNARYDDSNDEDRKRKRHAREMERERNPRDKKDGEIVEKRDRSVSRRSSPKRRKTRGVPRYMVQIPKVSLTLSESDVLELRRREYLFIYG